MRGVVKIDRPLFQKAATELKELIASLTPEQLKITEMETFLADWDRYEGQFDIVKETDEGSAKHCRGIIEGIHDDLKEDKEKKEFEAKNLSVPNLLARYQRLAPEWKAYVAKRAHMNGYDSSDGELSNETLFEQFAAIEEEAVTGKDRSEARKFIDTFSTILTKVENTIKESI